MTQTSAIMSNDQNEGHYVYVKHDFYDAWDCGHRAYLCDAADSVIAERFEFSHPYGMEFEKFATEFCGAFWPSVSVKLEICEVSDE